MLPIELVRGSFYFKINQYGKRNRKTQYNQCFAKHGRWCNRSIPIIQKTSVTYTLNARLYKEKAEGMVWKTKSDVKNMQFIVTRIA